MKKCYVLIMWSILCVACANDFETAGIKRTHQFSTIEDDFLLEHGIPVASLEELENYAYDESYQYEGVLNYKFARDYAFAEFIADIANYYPPEVLADLDIPDITSDISSLRFSSRPVVVYDYVDKPYYYEFPLIYNEDLIIGTVTVAAQPRTKELIEYMFPSPIVYNEYSFLYRRYIGEYPWVYFGNGGGYSIMMGDSMCLKPIIPMTTENNYSTILERKLLDLNQDELDSIEMDLHEGILTDGPDISYATLLDYMTSLIDDCSTFWDSVTTADTLTRTIHFELTPEILTKINQNIDEIQTSYRGFLSEYMSHYLRLTYWNDYCGPSILSWLYRGKYDSFNDKYLPLFGDPLQCDYYTGEVIDYPWVRAYSDRFVYDMDPRSNEDNSYETRFAHSSPTDAGLYYTFFQECSSVAGEFPLYDAGIRAGVRNATHNDYKIKFITAPISWIRDENQPVVVEGIRGHLHYWGAIGYAYDVGFLGIKKHMRIFVMDNGVYTAEYNHYPYWSILGGLNYAWKEN